MQEGRLLFAGSPSALQCLVGHRKAVPAREASLKASKEGPAGRSAWPARQSGNAESCQLSHLVGSTVLEGKFAPLSASVVRSSRSCPSCLEDLVQKHRFTTHVKANLLAVSKYPPSDRDHEWRPFSSWIKICLWLLFWTALFPHLSALVGSCGPCSNNCGTEADVRLAL